MVHTGGLLTAAVVAAAIATLPPARSGLASGVNNTFRQAGTALGVAVFGALTGNPRHSGRFVAALHRDGILGAVLWLAAGGVTWPDGIRTLPGAAVPVGITADGG